jgi:hypothetical protein
MNQPGRMRYVPISILEEAEDLKAEKNLKKTSDALREIAKYSQIGREAERIMKLDFHWKPKQIKDLKRKTLWRQ